MPINKKWKIGIVSGFTILALALLLIPYKVTTYYPGPQPNDRFETWIDENQTNSMDYYLPWRSYDQQFSIYINASEGRFTIEILNQYSLWDKTVGREYEAYFRVTNLTFFEDIITLYPLQNGPIYITITAEEYTVLNASSILTYYSYYSNYGFFFLGISLLLTSFYVYQKFKGAF